MGQDLRNYTPDDEAFWSSTGKGIANPLATISAGAMLLRHSLNLEAEAKAIEDAVSVVLNEGLRTADIASGGPSLSTTEMGDRVVAAIG